MHIVKVLKRKDASSVIVAIVLAFCFSNFLTMVSGRLPGLLLGLDDGTYASYSFPGSGFKGTYLYPFVTMLFQFLILEVFIALVIWLRSMLVRKSK